MSNWKLINKTYLYDGTFYGLLTIVFDCYCNKTLPQKIEDENFYIDNFLDKTQKVTTNYEKANRVFLGIEKNISPQCLSDCYYAFLSNGKDKEISILKYLCDGFELGPKITHMLTVSYVFNVTQMRKRALSECHRFKGLLRFQEVGQNLCYASIHPDNHILEPLGQHFMKRLPTLAFMIHDKNRDLCFLYHNQKYQIVEAKQITIPPISCEEKKYQELWDLFFHTIAISERTNRRCQMQFMPKKYWKDLIEKV